MLNKTAGYENGYERSKTIQPVFCRFSVSSHCPKTWTGLNWLEVWEQMVVCLYESNRKGDSHQHSLLRLLQCVPQVPENVKRWMKSIAIIMHQQSANTHYRHRHFCVSNWIFREGKILSDLTPVALWRTCNTPAEAVPALWQWHRFRNFPTCLTAALILPSPKTSAVCIIHMTIIHPTPTPPPLWLCAVRNRFFSKLETTSSPRPRPEEHIVIYLNETSGFYFQWLDVGSLLLLVWFFRCGFKSFGLIHDLMMLDLMMTVAWLVQTQRGEHPQSRRFDMKPEIDPRQTHRCLCLLI